MADSLRRLVNNEGCRMLQEKLETWYKDYYMNSCDQNLNCCCEIIELNSRIQGQLFTILSLTAQEGGHYAGVETIKSRLLPWLGTCFSNSSVGKPIDNNLSLFQESLEKDRQLRELSAAREREIQQLDSELNSTRVQLSMVQQELKSLQAQDESRQRSLEMLTDYERQLRALKDEIAVLSAEKSVLQSRLSRSRSPSPDSQGGRPSSPVQKEMTLAPLANRMSTVSRKANLLARFSDAYAQGRLEAQTLLKRYIDKMETVQRIIYIATVESFHVAKMAFRHFKIRVRKTLTPGHIGAESIEDIVMDYIICHLDLYDVQSSVNDVIRAMNVNPKISFPPEVDFIVISCFIKEICCIAFAMQTLDPPLDIAFGADGEIFNDSKYRRSCDSDFTAPLVFYHVWPALMENEIVIMKGEAVTKRGAFWSSVRNINRSRSRSLSPIHHRGSLGKSGVSRSRSPSPPRNINTKRSSSMSRWVARSGPLTLRMF
ncbi:mitochondria-eating protein isoform X4 [Trichosurus vulpecula]|uniref:mitochondria-eating protein isoform X4 n=1 Tax=Trichosurus vulpecula TaxID=9337 RepID=UPI00186AD1C8|nr:mitochondria-eating protein isoform X4 [Trichosurus vulpecula]XP_036620149.1 mitochondria-eating protein isoform X4 [Trichosurus vulpecula]XP_036620150.1 mitochondria-eating protein isoform X4 [Trichosurus vulpecula]